MGCYDFTILILYIGKSLLIGVEFLLLVVSEKEYVSPFEII